MIEIVREELLKLKDEEYAKFNRKLCPDTLKKIIGIRIPNLKSFAKKFVKENDGKAYLDEALKGKDKYFEEVLFQGLVIGYYTKMKLEEKIEYIKLFIPKIDSWAITDTVIPTFKFKEKELVQVWKFILPYTKSEKEFEVRFAVIVMLDYFIVPQYVDKVIKTLDGIKNDAYYAEMAIAWTLAEIGIKFNDKLMTYLKGDNHLDKFTYNKTLQKMIESYRISEEQKAELRSMKRKCVNNFLKCHP